MKEIFGAERDERFENVVLLEGDELEKTTAEDKGDYFVVREWEQMRMSERDFWFCRSSYSLPKWYVKVLSEI